MSAALRPLTTGELLDKTFQTYRHNFLLFAGISAVPHVCLLVVQLAAITLLGTGGSDTLTVALIALVLALANLVIILIVNAVATAATTFGVSDVYLEKPTSISSSFRRVRGKIARVVFTSIIYGLVVGVGFVLLIVPGIYWAGKYGLAVPAVVLEDLKARQSLDRSAVLTKDAIGRIVVIYFLTWILVVAISAGLGAALGVLAPSLAKAAGTITSQVVTQVLGAVVNTMVTPIMAIALTLAYYDQRVRKEAFDIENMMALLGEPAPAPATKVADTGI